MTDDDIKRGENRRRTNRKSGWSFYLEENWTLETKGLSVKGKAGVNRGPLMALINDPDCLCFLCECLEKGWRGVACGDWLKRNRMDCQLG